MTTIALPVLCTGELKNDNQKYKTRNLKITKIYIIYNCKLIMTTVIILNFRTDRYGQTVQTQIRMLLEEQSDQGLHCLLLQLLLFGEIP